MFECTDDNYTKIKQLFHYDSDSLSDTTDWDKGGWADANPDKIHDRGCPWTRLKRQYAEAREICTLVAHVLYGAMLRKRDEYAALAEEKIEKDNLSWPPLFNPYLGTYTRRYNQGSFEHLANFWDKPDPSVRGSEQRASL